MYEDNNSVHGSVVSRGVSERSIDFDDDVWEGRRENRLRRQARKAAALNNTDSPVKSSLELSRGEHHQRLPGLVSKGVQMTDKVLGTGESGQVYEGIMVKTGMKVAIKTEPVNAVRQKLQHEKEILSQLRGTPGIPQLIWFGVDNNSFVLVLELCGSNMRSLLEYCDNRLSMKTVLNIADKLLIILESIHKQGIVHRDLCPENILMGRGMVANEVYLIDHGSAEKYTDMMTGKHRLADEKSDTENSEENPNHCDFTSTNVYKGECAYSRRDDLESLAYLMIYMLRGELPWTVMWNSAKDTPKYRNLTQSQFVQSIKMKTKPEALTQGLPSVFCQFVKDLKKLGYDEKPQYEVYRKKLRTLYAELNLSHDYRWDWVVKQDKEDMKARAGLTGSAFSRVSKTIKNRMGGHIEAVSPTRTKEDRRSPPTEELLQRLALQSSQQENDPKAKSRRSLDSSQSQAAQTAP